MCKREGFEYVCVQREEATAQIIAYILDDSKGDISNEENLHQDGGEQFHSKLEGNEEMTTSDKGRDLQNTNDLLEELSELEKIGCGEHTIPSEEEGKKKSTKTLGSNRKTRSQARASNN